MITLRDYQKKAIEDVRHAWAAGFKRPCVVMPCGAGKSVIAAEIAKRTTDNGKRVQFLVHRKELCEQIWNTFSGYGVNMMMCDVGMVQTVCRRIDSILPPALIITDENHHCLAESYRKIYAAFPEAYCVGITATPIRLNGSGLGDVNDCLIIGPTVKELISQSCLAPFDYYAPAVADLSGIRVKRTGDYDQADIENALDKPHIYGDVISYYRKLADGKKAVCYCATINFSKKMAEDFNGAGIPAAHIDGKTPKEERAETVEKFRRGEIQILCNVDLLSEGFDVPDCDCSILLRPTKSLTLFVQQSMRCMRYKPGKRAIIIDHVGNVHRFGLPDENREWTLDAKKSKKIIEETEKNIKIRQCGSCFSVHEYAPVCPYCGYVYPVKERSIEESKEARLERITEAVKNYGGYGECQNYEELDAYRKLKNYKPGYTYYKAMELGFLRPKRRR